MGNEIEISEFLEDTQNDIETNIKGENRNIDNCDNI